MMIGSSLALVSANIRLWCYTEMRDLYDFEVNIKKAHRLVTTGPYSLVRHPGYIASCVARIGVSMVMFSKDHWLYQCGLTSTVGVVLSCIWCTEVVLINGIIVPARMKVEDDGLRRRFGKEWDEYASRVAYRLVPKVY
ncbi:Protein-S-isoprenylcysteine O-methyltransferase [Pleurotus pulmonarius]